MIPHNLRREHVLKAIEEINKNGIPENRVSRKFLLEHDGKRYPPKYLISLANRFASQAELDPTVFSGGIESNSFLESLGFRIIPRIITDKGSSKSVPAEQTVAPINNTLDKRTAHNEHCLECKEKILAMLKRAYGEAQSNYRLDFETRPKYFRDMQHYQSLAKIFKSLQDHRGFSDFVKKAKLPPFDFFVPNPPLIIEFDESQHFTKPREITLRNYPDSLKLGYDKEVWVQRCRILNKKDNDPHFRDEQRAWYDTLRDFCCNIQGIPIIRLLPEEAKWCGMNPESDTDIVNFKRIIERKLEQVPSESDRTKGSFRIGLVFPEIQKQNLKDFLPLIDLHSDSLNLLIFPEGFETIRAKGELSPEMLFDSDEMNPIRAKYAELSQRLNLSIIVGVQVYYREVFNMSGHDQYCLCLKPDGGECIYHKHSTSRLKAFFDTDWSPENNFPVIVTDGKKIGVSICHDMYISLIPRSLKVKGADIWVNLTGQNVRSRIWEAILRARAAENDFFAVCTLHRNSDESNPQKEPYAFSPKGKILLRDLITKKEIDSIEQDKRAGRIYFFDTADYTICPCNPKGSSALSKGADRMVISLSDSSKVTAELNGKDYKISEIGIEDFLYFPEKLWKICLKHKNEAVFFIVQITDNDWQTLKPKVDAILPARVIEFSTLFVFADTKRNKVFTAAYRSSNYKDTRIFDPQKFPIEIDQRYLKGLESTYKISLGDPRDNRDSVYFDRIQKMIDFLTG